MTIKHGCALPVDGGSPPIEFSRSHPLTELPFSDDLLFSSRGARSEGADVALIDTPGVSASECPHFPFDRSGSGPLDLAQAHLALAGNPLAKVTLPAGQPDTEAWLVTGMPECLEVYRNGEVFSRAQADGVKPFLKMSPIINALDGEHHRRIRGLVAKEFTPSRVERLRPMVESLAADVLRRMMSSGSKADLFEDFAMPLTLGTIGGQLGIPEEDRSKFRVWGQGLMATGPGAHEKNQAAVYAMCGYMAEVMAARRSAPVDDLLSVIITNADAAGVSAEEAALLGASLVVAGWESTAASIVMFAYLLLTSLDEDGTLLYRRLCSQPDLVPGAVEEMLRVVPNSIYGASQPRRALVDVELGGVLVRAGELVIPSHDMAARDERVFADPQRIDFERSPNPHLAFVSGAHVCPGAPLARMELQVTFKLFLEEMPALRLAAAPEDLVWQWTGVIRQPKALPVAW
ncbi:cytochrome P450 [Actinomadura rudentiformis]|uniref:Cytochrome P450 n=1 Tax=Actinomadura rudentiformis TaxID=359158 RepID=A0A6H9YH47_9ACTN|nr:cytochrome P450 [Actinomadura rudentiformis]KAB2339773.1 cytochrome P450 [Actinomadura rudentiformis]